MKERRRFWPALIILLAVAASAPEKGTIVVEMTSFRNNNGQACVTLFNQPDGFPNMEGKAFRKAFSPIENARATVVFREIPYGEYAVGMIHDENKNFKIETSRIGIPREGYGASNDAPAIFGPPKYSSARFSFTSERHVIQVKVKYF